MLISDTNEGVIVAQCESFSRKMPVFLGAIAACMVAQIVVFYGKAPILLAAVMPAVIAVIAVVRAVWWIKRRRRSFTSAEASRELKRAQSILLVSTAIIISFDVLLFQYVDYHSRYFLIVTFFGGTMAAVYSLMHIRSAAYFIVAALLCSLIFTLRALPLEIAIGLAIALASLTAGMVHVMRSYYGDFLSLIGTKVEAQALSAENFRLASIDMLTEMPNRRRFFADLQSLFDQARERGGRLAVAIADLDGFKPINDTHGHAIGDRVLVEVGRRLGLDRGVFQHVYRLGGDEFALIAEHAQDDERLLGAAQDLIARVCRPLSLGEICTSTGCSIGVAIYPEGAKTPDLLYERADYALYHAKRSGRNQAVIFSREHEQQIRAQGAVEQALRAADLELEFSLAFQPIVRVSDGRPLGFECLARWNSPILGIVSPGIFIPVAEQSGLIANLTPILLRKALAEAARWPRDIRMSFNLSPHDLSSCERVLQIIAIIGQSQISPDRIDLEMTETALLNDFEQARHNMAALKAIGVNISLDDFGTGYSSLSHVHALPLDKIKIDKSFVKNLDGDLAGQLIVRSMMTLCKDLQLACIVEGVETDEQLKTLSLLGCDLIQGFYFAKPMEAGAVLAYLDGQRLAA